MSRGPWRGDGPRARAVAILREVLERGARAAPLVALRGEGLSEPDRGLLRELVLGVLRWKDALDGEIAGTSRIPLQRLAPNLREILEVALYQVRHLDRVPDYAA
ncbi:MAG: transcription antitermination factor NusB, partial [Thermoanaerobaculia bacterium]